MSHLEGTRYLNSPLCLINTCLRCIYEEPISTRPFFHTGNTSYEQRTFTCNTNLLVIADDRITKNTVDMIIDQQ